MFGILAGLLVVSPPVFRGGNGWHVGAQGAWGWASTVPNRDCRDCVPPHRTLAHLPPGGILFQLGNYPAEHPPQASPGKWPPRIVWFGRRHPTRRQLARANAELRTVR